MAASSGADGAHGAHGADVAVLGLAGLRLLAALVVDGEVELLVETTAGAVGCTGCGVRARSHGRREVVVRDLPITGRASRLRWRKRLWRCHQSACSRVTWTERHPQVPPRASWTERARAEACRRVGEDNDPVAQVARHSGVGWQTVMRAVVDHGTVHVDEPERVDGVASLGLDETAFQRRRRGRPLSFVTGFVDLDRARLLDVVQDRTAAAASTWLTGREDGWTTAVRVVAIDPYAGYATAVRSGGLDHATLVVDHFHAAQLAGQMVDDVRRRVQQETTGHRGRKGDPLYGIRRVLRLAADRLDERGWARLDAGLAAGDPDHEVYNAWAVKELLRDVYQADDLDAAQVALADFYAWAEESAVPECRRLARTIRRWQAAVLAWHTTSGASNGPTEAVNLSVKQVKRAGRGFRNFANYRLRLLLHCGTDWNTSRPARLRARGPRLIA